MNNIINNIINAARNFINWVDTQLTQRFPTWGKMPSIIKWAIAVIAVIFLAALAKLGDIIVHNQDTIWAIAFIVVSIVLFLYKIRRSGVIVTAIQIIITLLLLKYTTTLYGADSTYIDSALKGIADIPRIIWEVLIPWLREGPLTLI